ncbi:MAG TPA: HEAT repeat domain-containing protein [Syntrophorhabdaceae bacterium]|nr:HEAT repeat domain-containing protein [Syntrophorhabdaceae bacterium]
MNQTAEESSRGNTIDQQELSYLVGLLRSGDNYEKEKVVETLISAPGKKTVQSVVPLLYEDNTGVRMVAHEVLRKTGSHDLDSIVALLEDKNEDIRVYACEILSSIGDSRALPSIIRRIYEDEENVRNAACIALGEFSDERAVRALLDSLKDDEWIAFSAVFSLGKIGDPEAAGPLFELFKDGPEELSVAACEVLIDFNDTKVLDEMFEQMKQWDHEKRGAYLKVILEKGNEDTFHRLQEKIGDELFEHLLKVLKSEDANSIEFLRMLSNFRNKKACDAMLRVLSVMDREAGEFNEALELFVSLKGVWEEYAEEYMENAEEYLLPFIRACRAARVRVAEPVLLKVFRSSSVDVKRELIVSLPDIVDGNGRSITVEGMRDVDGHIKGDSAIAAGLMGLSDLKGAILEIAKKGFMDVRIKALKVLIAFDMEEAKKAIDDFVYNGTSDDKRVYLASACLLSGDINLPFTEHLLRDPDESVVRGALGVSGNFIDDKRYLDFLEAFLTGPAIPHEVLKIIKEKRLRQFKDRLIDIFIDKDKSLWTRYYALSALGAFEEPSLFDVFARGLNEDSSLIKIGSIKALADLKDEKATGLLAPFLDDPDEDVRSAAAFVLNERENAKEIK